MPKNIKIRLIQLGKTQRWLLMELHKRGFSTVHEPLFSNIINGIYTAGCANVVLEAADELLAQYEDKSA